MKHPLRFALLLLGSTPLTLLAQNAELYGRFHVSMDHLQADSQGEGTTLSSNSSRLGVRGKQSVTDALAAIWQVEVGIRAENDSAISTDRDTFVGLIGNWGQLRAGRFDTPMKRMHSRVNLFGDQVGDARNLLRADDAATGTSWWDERLRNSIAYRSPAQAGATASLHYSTNQDSGAATSSDQASWSASLEWQGKNLWLGVAHEDSGKTVGGNFIERRATRASANLELGGLRLVGLWQHARHPDITAWGAGLRYAASERIAVKSHYYQIEARNSTGDAELFAVGLDYTLAKPLMFYLNYGQVINGDSSARTPWKEGRSDSLVTGDGDAPEAVSIGMVYRF
ncbi:MAG: porin [Alcanivoracaceae bacterium]